MKQILKKIVNMLFGSKIHDAKTLEREQKTKVLIEKELSDAERWKNDNELHPNWNERTEILASYIQPGASIIEFGAGVMHLKQAAKEYKMYTPSDIVKRYDETVVCDLNQHINIDLLVYDVAVFSGVLEYVYDIDNVIKQLEAAKINHIILSYCCSDIVKLSRTKNGWLSDYSKADLEQIFANHNYKINDYSVWNNQSLFNLIKVD